MESSDFIKNFMKQDRYAVHSNIELVSASPGQALAKMPVAPYHLNGLGIVMGGAIFTLADFAFAAACNSHDTVAVAINVNISFIKSAKGGTLWAQAREISKNHKLGTYTVEVKDEAGELIALFQGMAYRKADKAAV